MFADDTNAVVRAKIQFILEFRDILDKFGQVSGLCFTWEKTVAAFIPASPPAFWLFPWRWEENGVTGLSLGIPTAQ